MAGGLLRRRRDYGEEPDMDTEVIASRVAANVLTAASRTTTLNRDIRTKSGTEFKSGERVSVSWQQGKPSYTFIESVDNPGNKLVISTANVGKTLHGYPKAPGIKALEKWSDDGVAKSILGNRVEPDGWDHEGSPSWLLALSMI